MRARIIYYVVRGRVRKSVCEKKYTPRENIGERKLIKLRPRSCVYVCAVFDEMERKYWPAVRELTMSLILVRFCFYCNVLSADQAYIRRGGGSTRFTCQKLINPPPCDQERFFILIMDLLRALHIGLGVSVCLFVRCNVIILYTYSSVI